MLNRPLNIPDEAKDLAEKNAFEIKSSTFTAYQEEFRQPK